jgi:hypothetical protein
LIDGKWSLPWPLLQGLHRTRSCGIKKSAHPFPFERRQLDLSLARVKLVIQDNHRMISQRESQEAIRLTRMHDPWIPLKDLLDIFWRGHHHKGTVAGKSQRKPLAIPPVTSFQHPQGIKRPLQQLRQGRTTGAGRKW